MPNQIIADRFVLLNSPERLGGTASVRKARDLTTDEPVAIKLFDGPDLEDELLRELYLRDREALTSLKHPNIVRLIDSGADERSGKHFIALEWVEEDLEQFLKRVPPEGWDTFADQILIPLLDGMALAHSRKIVHRDVKPKNILITPEGAPKLSDFGIAKLMESPRLGLTVRDFGSRPYAAPERLHAQPECTADLFSIGILILDCLKTDPLFAVEHDCLDEAVLQANLPPGAEAFVRRLIALDPSARPRNAAQALEELRQIQRQRPQKEVERTRIHLFIPMSKAAVLEDLFRCRGRDEVCQAICKDLHQGAAIHSCRSTSAERRDEAYYLLGQELSYHVVVESQEERYTDARLVVVGGWGQPPSQLASKRESYMPLHAEFTFQDPFSVARAKEVIEKVREDLAIFAQERKEREMADEERELFRRWRNILHAKRSVEQAKGDPISYRDYRTDGRNVIFTLAQPLDSDIVNQYRRVDTSKGEPVRGSVDAVSDDQLTLYVEKGNPKTLPRQGQILFETDTSKAALRRQEKALDEVQAGRSARPELKSLLVRPDLSSTPEFVKEPPLVQAHLDEAKQKAIQVALGARDFVIVQGPPGTGKTTWIAEFVCQFIAHQGERKVRVLLSAQTHIAVDNALEKMAELRPDLLMVRLGRSERISGAVETCRLENRMDAWRQEVEARCKQYTNQWAADHGITESRRQLGETVASLERAIEETRRVEHEIQALRDEQERLKQFLVDIRGLETKVWDQAVTIEALMSAEIPRELTPLAELADAYVSFGQQLAGKYAEATSFSASGGEVQERLEQCRREAGTLRAEVDELRIKVAAELSNESLREADLLVLKEAVQRAAEAAEAETRQLIRLQGIQEDWLRRFGRGDGFEKALIGIADIIAGTCVGIAAAGRIEEAEFDLVIIDEASKATPTEALVAMTRGKRWVLVGDQKQLPPFAEEDLRDEAVLGRFDLMRSDLETTLFDRLMASLPESCQARLTVQHRMLPAIGDLISECFYGGDLQSGRTDEAHPVTQAVLPRPVTWYSTSRLPNRGEREKTSRDSGAPSYVNAQEASQIRQWLEKLELRARQSAYSPSVGVISGYLGQKDLLAKEIDPGDTEKWQMLRIEVNTVDAFQGREVDVVVYSVTRSNPSWNIGHLRSSKRLNVALSRGKDALVVFGDVEHCRNCTVEDNPFLKVLLYMDQHSETCRIEVL
jgi:hypothetical protein